MKRRNFLRNSALGSAALAMPILVLPKEKEIDWSLEIERCKNDPVYFVETYCKVDGLSENDKRLIQFYTTNISGCLPFDEKIKNGDVLNACVAAHRIIFKAPAFYYHSNFESFMIYENIRKQLPSQFNHRQSSYDVFTSDFELDYSMASRRIYSKVWSRKIL